MTVGAAVVAFASAPAHATPVIKNGSFETVTTTASTEFGTRYGGQVVTNWTTGGYNFLFKPGTADTTGAVNEYSGPLKLWGPGDGSANGLPAASPDGGNFIGADGAYGQAAIQQTITGLDVNSIATITFYWAGAQQYNFDGKTTEAWQVTLGNETHSTQVLSNDTHGFTGWQKASLSFIVTSATEVLSFLALGTPAGVPPFSLLDGVSISEIPEPASLTLVGMGLALTVLVSRRRSRAS
ncbi:MAG TPA: PEP-CTERM sorting domain-containing protein [Acetobacteraceae bacterium]